MTEVLTAAQMKALEQAAIDSGEVTGLELMERAGVGVIEAIIEEWPELEKGEHRGVVLCGPGNNGGDGFVVARLLKELGWAIEVFLYGDAAKLPPDAKVNYQRWLKLGSISDWSTCHSAQWAAQPLVVDAVFGTGLSRPVPDEVRNVLMAILNCRRVAVDFPSFISTDTGLALNDWPDGISAANLTVTFHNLKRGHLTGAGPELCGKVIVKDIGL